MHVIRKNIKSFKKFSKIKGIHKWGICWPGEANGVSDIRTWENITKIKWSGNIFGIYFPAKELEDILS